MSNVYKDNQHDLTWEEQDRIKRRLDIKNKLKQEYVRKYHDPFLQIQRQIAKDPAVERFLAMRKTGRLPNSPLPFRYFARFLIVVFLPIPLYGLYYKRQVTELNRKVNSGKLPYEDREFKRWQCAP